MTNVVSISCTCDYLVKRAARHRRAGRYDEAMALLWKARNQFGQSDEVLTEIAKIYEETGCETEAYDVYLRLVRIGGKHVAWALFQLTILSAQRGDTQRAVSYFERLRSSARSEEISPEMIDALGEQLLEDIHVGDRMSAKRRAQMLEKRASALLQAGKAAAAQRAMAHSLHLRPTARGYTMLACCQLIRQRFDDAVASARLAHDMAPGNVQTLCVLADAYMACGHEKQASKAIYIAALRAKEADDLLSVAVESAKYGDDRLTILLSGRILKIAPFHTRAMMLRACAYINCRKYTAARKLLGRLCGLLPEDTVCESYYRMLCADKTFKERLSIGMDVTHDEGVDRAAELVSALYMDPKQIDDDPAYCLRLCRLAQWAFYSPMAGATSKTAALVLLASLQAKDAGEILLDVLMHPQISDAFKLNVLQVLTARDGFRPYDADMDGKLVRLAAGGVSPRPMRAGQANSKIVQRVADRLRVKDSQSPNVVLDAYLRYMDRFGQPDARHEDACAAALEYWYYLHTGKRADAYMIASCHNVSVRHMNVYVRRFEVCMQKKEQTQQGE